MSHTVADVTATIRVFRHIEGRTTRLQRTRTGTEFSRSVNYRGGMAAVVDYSAARPDPAGLIAQGYIGVMRYLGRGPGGAPTSYDIGITERARLHAAGLRIGFVFETSANAALGGAPVGRDHGRRATLAADQVGVPLTIPTFYAVDFGPTPTQLAGPVADYFRAARQVAARPVAVYGAHDVLDYLIGNGLAVAGWQCVGWSGYGPGSSGRYQRAADGTHRRLSKHAFMCQDIPETPVRGQDHNYLYDRAQFEANSWAPEHLTVATGGTHTAGARLEDLMHRPIHIPARGDMQWRLAPDGNGGIRRVPFSSHPELRLLVAEGTISGPTLTLIPGKVDDLGRHDELLEAFDKLPGPATAPVHEQLIGLGWHIAAAFIALTEQVAGGDTIDALDPDAFAALVAQAVADALVAEGVEIGLDPDKITELVSRVRLTLAPDPVDPAAG